jgi:hypothetical protein
MRLRYSIKACMPVCILEKEREHIRSIWSKVTYLTLLLLLLKVLNVKLLEILEVFGA